MTLYHSRAAALPQWAAGLSTSELWALLSAYDFKIRPGTPCPQDRYGSVKPFEHNAWHSKTVPYFNGSVVDLQLPAPYEATRIIAMQAPLPHTMADFVSLAVDSDLKTIVTVGNWQEGAHRKMEPYWLDQFPELVRCVEATKVGCWEERVLEFTDAATARRLRVRHIHFYEWMDHGMPEPRAFRALLERVCKLLNDGLLAVHCSAGVGRTGTLLAGLRCLLQARSAGGAAGARAVFEAVAIAKSQRFLSVECEQQFRFLMSFDFS